MVEWEMNSRMVNLIWRQQVAGKRGLRWAFAVLWLIGSASVCAQNVPLQVACQVTIYDQLGIPLSRQDGDLVQFLLVNEQVYPPGMDGQPNTNNPVVYEVRIGDGLIDHPSTVGRFNASIIPRPEGPIVTRVFNAPTLEDASFFADSQTFTPNEGEVFYPIIVATTNALDPADDDEDGLNNSMEKDLGTNPNLVDTDGDTFSDMDEFRAGTSGTNSVDFLAMVYIQPLTADTHLVQWDSVPGKSYQLQHPDQDLSEIDVVFVNVNAVVTATNYLADTTVTNIVPLDIQHYRVLLVE